MGPCSEETIIYLDYGDDCKKSHMAWNCIELNTPPTDTNTHLNECMWI